MSALDSTWLRTNRAERPARLRGSSSQHQCAQQEEMYEGKEKKGTAALDQPPPRINLSLTIARIWTDILATEPTEQGHRIPWKYGCVVVSIFPLPVELDLQPLDCFLPTPNGVLPPPAPSSGLVCESVVWCEWT